MMKSYQEEVKKQEQEKQQVIFSEVAAQREAVVAAQWSFFKTALLSDQATLEKISQVPNYVKAKLHAKAVTRRKQQSDAGEKATKGYQDICSQLGPFNQKNNDFFRQSRVERPFKPFPIISVMFLGVFWSDSKQDCYVRVTSVAKSDLLMAEVARMKAHVAACPSFHQ